MLINYLKDPLMEIRLESLRLGRRDMQIERKNAYK